MCLENPNGFAVQEYRWIGLKSPETLVYLRPRSSAKDQERLSETKHNILFQLSAMLRNQEK